MEEQFKDTILPGRWMWCVINNIQKFDDKPELIRELFDKYHKIKDHFLLSTYENIIYSIEDYFEKHNKFPDMETLKLEYRDMRAIVITNDKFSMQIFDSLKRYIEQEYIRQEIEKRILEPDNPNVDDIRELSIQMSKFVDNSVTIEETTKAALINSYDSYVADYRGIETHIGPIDKVIKSLGYQSLSVFAAPSGHGKSTVAFSIAYYAAITGSCVDYLSFEIPENHAWFNFVSIESEGKSHPLKAMDIKSAKLSEDEKGFYKENMVNLLARIKEGGGFLNIIDQTTSGADTYEGLCAMLETVAEKRGRKADLIVVDNIDNLVTLKSKERDETAKVNNMIIGLDGFSKKYYNGEGVAILLLSQVNRPAMKKLYTSANDEESKTKIDVTCIQKYNALYEKATCVLVGFADETARARGIMRVYPVKLRNAPVPEKPIQVSVDYAYSKVKGDFFMNQGNYSTPNDVGNRIEELYTGKADFESNDVEDPKPPYMTEEIMEQMELLKDDFGDEG